MQTQWFFSGMGQRTGLNYAGVESFFRINQLTITQENFAKLQHLERSLIAIDREQHAK